LLEREAKHASLSVPGGKNSAGTTAGFLLLLASIGGLLRAKEHEWNANEQPGLMGPPDWRSCRNGWRRAIRKQAASRSRQITGNAFA